jgi:DNA-binding beta-propeller fold protein YncE
VHGTPYGRLWKYATGTDTPECQTELWLFPATGAVSPDGYLAYMVNFNPVRGVATEEMQEIARVTTCVMMHGSRLSPDGSRHYSACMMEDMVVEIDTRTLKVSRHFLLRNVEEKRIMGAPFSAPAAGVEVWKADQPD